MKSRPMAFAGALVVLFAISGCKKPAPTHFLNEEERAAQLAFKSTDIIEAPTGHAYKYVRAPDLTWEAARAAAAKLSFHGQPGYLATIDDLAEYQFIMDRVFPDIYPGVTYLGGRRTSADEWRWVTGPDAAADGGKGKLFWIGADQGTVVGNQYANWMSTAFQDNGKWAVSKVCCVTLFSYGMPQFSTSLGNGDTDEVVTGYLVEFGAPHKVL